MKSPSFCRPIFALIISAALFHTANLSAATVAGAAPAPTAPVPAGNALGLLRSAYATLAVADHDYKGHRVKAIKAIENACKLLGTDISGQAKVKEPQAISDAQLRAALAQVQQAATLVPAGKGQKQIVNHINKAVAEITTALTIK